MKITESSELSPVISALNFVRTVQACSRTTEYDEPDLEDDTLNFRVNYQRGLDEDWSQWAETGEWSAYVIAPTTDGNFQVLHSRPQEKSARRAESCRAVFTSLTDAAKFVMVIVADSARSRLGLDSLFVIFRSRGLDASLSTNPAAKSEAAPLAGRLAPDKVHLADQIQRISLTSDPSRAVVGFPSIEPYANVLPLSLEQVMDALIAGFPPDVRECIDLSVTNGKT